MRFYLISDNRDTLLGMRLAGIDGVVVHEQSEVLKVLNDKIADSEIAVILITEKLSELVDEQIKQYKLGLTKPLIVEIPDRHGYKNPDKISGYVRDAIGIKL